MNERVWDRLLSEQDKAHQALGREQSVGFGKQPALLVIDMYRRVFGYKPEPLLQAVKTWPGSCGMAAWDALPHIQTLLAAARAAGLPIVHTTSLETEGVPGWQKNAPAWASDVSPKLLKDWKEGLAIIEEAAPLPGEVVLLKSAPSAFWGTPLVGILNRLGVDTIITCGESTSGCVRASVVDGCTSRYRMIVVEECVFDRTEASHAINLFDMNQKYADVLPLEEVLQYLRSWRAQKGPAQAASLGGRA